MMWERTVRSGGRLGTITEMKVARDAECYYERQRIIDNLSFLTRLEYPIEIALRRP